jgi:hypothetical protein
MGRDLRLSHCRQAEYQCQAREPADAVPQQLQIHSSDSLFSRKKASGVAARNTRLAAKLSLYLEKAKCSTVIARYNALTILLYHGGLRFFDTGAF